MAQSLIRQRGTEKGRLTVFGKWIDEWNPTVGLRALQLRIAKIEECYSKFNEIQSRILAEVDDESQKLEGTNFESNYFSILEKAYGIVDTHSIESPVEKQFISKPQVTLPKIQLTTFSGEITEWPAFSELFTALVLDNSTLTNVQKLYYLKSVLKDSAASIIQGLGLTNANLQVAWNLLQERYENKHLIINKLLQAITQCPKLESESSQGLSKLLDTIQRSVQSLEALREPIEAWNSILIHLVVSKLDVTTRKEWELKRSQDKSPAYVDLIKFLRLRSQVLDTLELENVATNKQSSPRKFRAPSTMKNSNVKKYTFTMTNQSCIVCKGLHQIFHCEKFLTMPLDQRLKEVKKLRLCFNCLRASHSVRDCSSSTCRKCSRKHNTLLHKELRVTNNNPQDVTENVETANTAAVCKIQTNSNIVLLSTAVVSVETSTKQWIKCRCLVDNGSQTNIITSRLCEKLKVPIQEVNIPVNTINNIVNTAAHLSSINIKSNIDSSYRKTISCLVLPTITGPIPAVPLNVQDLNLPQDLNLADPTFNEPGQIDMLLGAQVFWEILQSSYRKLGPNKPVLRASRLGYLVTGSLPAQDKQTTNVACLLNQTSRLEKQLERFWKLEEISEPTSSPMETQKTSCESIYRNTVTRQHDGRYVVTLPRNVEVSSLGESSYVASKRLFSLEKQLECKPLVYQQYREFMEEYSRLGHMDAVLDDEYKNTEHYFIPHFAVVREQSESTPLRVVFNASQATSTGVSLNDTLLGGPTIQDDLISILLRFRTYCYALVGDISKFFRQILIDSSQRNLQLIYWRETSDQPKQIYRLNTITYGMTSSPYLATRTLNQLYQDEGEQFPLAKSSQNNWYMDDYVGGGNDLQTVINMRREITSLLKLGGFPVKKWISNEEQILNTIPLQEKSSTVAYGFDDNSTVHTLGMIWRPKADQFSYAVNVGHSTITKRHILSDIASIFDPLGLIGPVLTTAKIIMQELWRDKLEWDQVVPLELQNKWIRFREDLKYLHKLHLPRCIQPCRETVDKQLHIFGDASLLAYGSCAYLRVESSNQVSSRLVMAKSRIAPIKQVTLPKLELAAAVLSTKLTEKIMKALDIKNVAIHYWTDSSIVLAWLNSTSKQEVFVANRVTQILQHSDSAQWHHVPSHDNPADIISRGSTVQELNESRLWYEGPAWLIQNESHWPSTFQNSQLVTTSNSPCLETSVNPRKELPQTYDILQRYSSMNTLHRVVAYCLRFISNSKRQKEHRIIGPLLVEELNVAWERIIKMVQEETFQTDIQMLKQNKSVSSASPLKQLDPFLDSKGLLRVGGRIQRSEATYETKHPMILPSKHNITKLIVRQEHVRNLHAGSQLLLGLLRQKVWILNARRTIRSVLHHCVVCFRAKPVLAKQQMGILPAERVREFRPFLKTGVDMAGPIYIKQSSRRNAPVSKAYFAIFVCLVIKAVHIELVPDLTTNGFINALKRFISRRGLCDTIVSDNGTNFVGTNRELSELRDMVMSENYQRAIINAASHEGIQWKFIPPKSPHHGGLFEASVKQAKFHLRRVIGTDHYTYDQMNTLLTQVEACLNSRPLVSMSEDPNDLQVLTPAHFLVGDSLKTIPEPDLTQLPENRLDIYQLIQKKMQSFWKRWRTEYLSSLQTRVKWFQKKPNITKGMIVLIEDKQLPPMQWKLGRIQEVYPGEDGLVRVVSVKTPQGIINRSIQKIAPLPWEIKLQATGARDVAN